MRRSHGWWGSYLCAIDTSRVRMMPILSSAWMTSNLVEIFAHPWLVAIWTLIRTPLKFLWCKVSFSIFFFLLLRAKALSKATKLLNDQKGQRAFTLIANSHQTYWQAFPSSWLLHIFVRLHRITWLGKGRTPFSRPLVALIGIYFIMPCSLFLASFLL